jgi:LPXTG-site transpeptidase (sortase) family protein
VETTVSTPEGISEGKSEDKLENKVGEVRGEEPRKKSDRKSARVKKGQSDVTALVVFSDLLFTLVFFLALYFIWLVWWTAVPAYYEQKEASAKVQWDVPEDPNTPAVPLDYMPCDSTGATDDKYRELWGVDWKEQYNSNWKNPLVEKTMIGRSYVPKWGADYSRNIVQGTNKVRVLDRQGYGHYENTAMPGCVGNFAAAAHRDGYGAPMGDIDKLVVGDALVVRTLHYWYVYDMSSYEIVDPSNGTVINPVPGQSAAVLPTERLLTYTTCHPRWSLDKRYIVHAKFKYWAEVRSGVPQELLDVGTHIDF